MAVSWTSLNFRGVRLVGKLLICKSEPIKGLVLEGQLSKDTFFPSRNFVTTLIRSTKVSKTNLKEKKKN